MGYYADVSRHIDFARSLLPDEAKTLEDILESGWYEFEDGLNRSTSCRDVDFWSSDKYYYDTEDMLNRIAEKLPVKTASWNATAKTAITGNSSSSRTSRTGFFRKYAAASYTMTNFTYQKTTVWN